MKVRADVAELLLAGRPDSAIARELNVCAKSVGAARAALKLPKAKTGRRPAATAEDLFWRRTQPVDGGHLLWTGHLANGCTPALRHGGRVITAYRVAFRIRHGREPDGNVTKSCDVDGCVHPNCMDDRTTRQRTDAAYTAIFGTPA